MNRKRKTAEEVIEACPICGSSGILFKTGDGMYYVECVTEGSFRRTDTFYTIEVAINAWNNQEIL